MKMRLFVLLFVLLCSISSVLAVDPLQIGCKGFAHSCLDPNDPANAGKTAEDYCYIITGGLIAGPNNPPHLNECCKYNHYSDSVAKKFGDCGTAIITPFIDISSWQAATMLSPQCDGIKADPCSPNGKCIRGFYGYVCQCNQPSPVVNPTSWPYGANCALDSCVNSTTGAKICVNGDCVAKGPGLFECHCRGDFRGRYCDIQDPCGANRGGCVHGQCVANTDPNTSQQSIKCICSENWRGVLCDDQVCGNFGCLNGGKCNSTRVGLTDVYNEVCICQSGFSGDKCETPDAGVVVVDTSVQDSGTIIEAFSNGVGFCYSFTTCLDPLAPANRTNYQQYCYNVVPTAFTKRECCPFSFFSNPAAPPGPYGATCNSVVGGVINPAVCIANPCLNGGTCTAGIFGYVCTCANGYRGPNCTLSACDHVLCHNGATCHSLVNNGFKCACRIGYSGTYCDAYDPCHDNRSCGKNGVCIGYVNGTYSCACDVGWHGVLNCNQGACQIGTCLNGGVCEVLADGITPVCHCPKGTATANCACKDATKSDCVIVERGSPPPNPQCSDYTSCLNPFSPVPNVKGLSGLTAADFCFVSPLNTIGYNCCPMSLFSSSISIAEAMGINTGDIGYAAHINGNADDILFCQFQALDQTRLTLPNTVTRYPCDKKPCQNGGICTDFNGFYTCQCLNGFTGQDCGQAIGCNIATTCEDLTQRDADPSKCFMNLINRTDCCLFGYWTSPGSATSCDSFVNPNAIAFNQWGAACSFLPCQNGGTCIPAYGMYTCKCKDGYFGHNCTQSYCDHAPCGVHAGTCKLVNTGYSCTCNAHNGWHLDPLHCNLLDTCWDTPCPDHSTCNQTAVGLAIDTPILNVNYECLYDHCYDNQCQNNATCVSNTTETDHASPHAYACRCKSGFYDPKCSKNICNPNPCIGANRTGTWVDTKCLVSPDGSTALCVCEDGYGGIDCSKGKSTDIVGAIVSNSNGAAISPLGIGMITMSVALFAGGSIACIYLYVQSRRTLK